MAIPLRILLALTTSVLPLLGTEEGRVDLARAISSVSTGMQADEVMRLLGKPDDIRTQFDPGGISTSRTTEIWCYGTSGRLTFPTLGCVFMEAGGAQYVYGGKGAPPAPVMLDEAELRKLLQLIDNLSQSRGNNPLLYIQLVMSYSLAGSPQLVEAHLDDFRKNGKWRKNPLHPSNQPLELLAALERSPRWIYKGPRSGANFEWEKNHLAEQLLRLVSTVYRIESDQDGRMIPRDRFDPQHWDKIVKDVAALEIKWDVAKNIYVVADGSSLPEVKEPIHMRQIWKIPGLGPSANLIFERKNRDYILLRMERSGVPRLDSVVKVYQTEARDNPLVKYRISASDNSGSSQTSQDIFLPAGDSLQAEIVTDGKTTKSPVFTP